jgi:hypothetical protein
VAPRYKLLSALEAKNRLLSAKKVGAGFFSLALILHHHFPAWWPAARHKCPENDPPMSQFLAKIIETNRNESRNGT